MIADHNSSFKPNARSSIRFSQSKGTIEDDTIDQWRAQRQWHTHAVELVSWDYRSLSSRSAGEHSGTGVSTAAYVPAGTPQLISQDTPGAYAYESTAQGQRLATQQLQCLSVPGHSLTVCGSVCSLSAGSTFTLSWHASAGVDSVQHTVPRVLHHARNTLSAQLNGYAHQLVKYLTKSALDAPDTGASSYGINSFGQTDAHSNTQNNTQNNIFYRNVAH